jgi:hypothetical protein
MPNIECQEKRCGLCKYFDLNDNEHKPIGEDVDNKGNTIHLGYCRVINIDIKNIKTGGLTLKVLNEMTKCKIPGVFSPRVITNDPSPVVKEASL